MRYLPELERELFQAAARLETESAASDRRWSFTRRWRRMPLLAGAAVLLLAGAAVAAATGVLSTGDPVPSRTSPQVRPAADNRIVLSDVRAADPDGGPDWGIGTYEALPPAHVKVPADIRQSGRLTCVVVGRVQDGQLGVVGRDGVFANDGRFHPLNPSSDASGGCGGRYPDGALISMSGPAIPASGYTGPPGTAIGGCRERVDLDGPTISPQTRARLRHLPPCDAEGLRHVVAGFAGKLAETATLTSQGHKLTQELDANADGPYLFVVRGDAPRPSLTFTLRDGTTCQGSPSCSGLAKP